MEENKSRINTDLDSADKASNLSQANPNPQNPTPKKSKLVYVFLALFVLLVLTVGASAAVYISKSLKPSPSLSLRASPTPLKSPEASPSPVVSASPIPSAQPKASFEENTNVPGQKKYISPKFGMSFLYMVNQGTDQTAAVKEEADKLYVYVQGLNSTSGPSGYKNGQWVQVFKKEKSTSLEDAIKNQLLSGYSEKDCFVVVKSIGFTTTHFPSNYKTATISYPKPTDDTAPFFAGSSKCPQTYSETNGLSYFLEDTNFPDRFYFFSIGQYYINASKNQGWQETATFLPF